MGALAPTVVKKVIGVKNHVQCAVLFPQFYFSSSRREIYTTIVRKFFLEMSVQAIPSVQVELLRLIVIDHHPETVSEAILVMITVKKSLTLL